MKVKVIVTDDDGTNYEGEIILSKNTKNPEKKSTQSSYRPGSTAEKIILLINEGFFNENHIISEIVEELKTHDFHFKSSDLTLPLRNLVRKNQLKKTKKLLDGSTAKQWTYIKR